VKNTFIALIPAQASSGASHPILVEKLPDGRPMITVMGADGKKRHASSILPATVDAHEVARVLGAK
jgi:hypothetical protein